LGFHTFFFKGPLNTQTLVSAIVFFSARPFWGCQSGGWHRPNYEHLSWDNQCPLETCARTERHPRKKNRPLHQELRFDGNRWQVKYKTCCVYRFLFMIFSGAILALTF
jgi:hypothetical protein